jgi:anti-sigma factor RsiW
MNTDTAHRHIDAADLIRLLDGELVASDRAAAEQALAVCDVCREQATRLRQRSARLSTRLADADWPAPPAAHAFARLEAARPRRPVAAPRWSFAQQPRLRLAAAIALVMLAGTLTVTPAAAWLGRALERAWHALTSSDAGSGDATAPAPTQDIAERRAFVPAAGAFTVHCARAEDAVVELSAGADTLLVLRVFGAPVAEVLQEERTLRIDNPPMSGRVYRIVIPEQVSEVRLVAGAAAPVVVSRVELAAGFTRSLRDVP